MLLLLLAGLVVLAPTIASTAAVRSVIVGQINNNLNGTVQIADWSLGWFSPIDVSGVRVYDEQNRLILDVPRIRLGVSLLNAAKQNFALGNDNVVEIASFVVRVDEQGRTNFEKLARTSAATPEPASTQPTKLPDISGKLTINIHQGTLEGPAGAPPVHVDPSSVVVNIPDINRPIENAVKLAYHVGNDERKSTIEISGTVDAIENNLPNIEQLVASLKISLANVQLAAAEPFLRKIWEDVKLAGVLNGALDAQVKGLSGLSGNGQIIADSLLFAGGPLKGDTYRTSRLAIPIQITRTELDANTTLIRIEKLGVATDQATITLAGQVPEQALLNLADRRAPGGSGSLTINVDVPGVADLANQLRHTLQLQPGVAITGGEVHANANFTFLPDRVIVSKKLNAFATGTRDGRQVQLQPITVSVDAAAIPTAKPIPNIRDLKLAIDSAFAKVTGGGESLAKLGFAGNFDLGRMHSELSQFVDMGRIQLAGTGEFNVGTDGDLTDESTPVTATANATVQNVKIAGVLEQPIDQDRLAVNASGKLLRSRGALAGIESGYLQVLAGDPASPLLDLQANANIDLSDPAGVKAPWFELKRFAVTSLARLQQQYGALVPALAQQKINIESGAIYANAAGTFDGKTISLARPLAFSVPSLTLSRDGRRVLNREVIRGSINGNVMIQPGIGASLTELSVATESDLFKLAKAGDAPLTFAMGTGQNAALRGSGVVSLAANLARLSSIAQAFGAQPAPDQPQLRSGLFDGTITLVKADRPQTDIQFDAKISALTIQAGGKNAIDNEQLTIALTASAPDDLKGAAPIVASGRLGSSFANVDLADVKLSLAGALLEMVQSANVQAAVPSVPKLYALASAIAPPAPAEPVVQGTQPLPPLQITSGNAAVKVSIARDAASKTTRLNLSEAHIRDLGVRRGAADYHFDRNTPITLQLAASLQGTDKIEAIKVDQLSGDLRIATLSMSEPIVITDPLGRQASYAGAIRASGTIEDATPLLAVLQGGPELPYRGAYQLAQQLGTRGDVTTLNGSIDVTKFQVLGKDNRPAFTEDRIAVRNDIALNLPKQVLRIANLSIEMPQSQALAVKLVGGVNDWSGARLIAQGTRLQLSYDLARLWTILYPMLSPEQQQNYKDVKIAGKYERTFVLSGAFPARPALAESIASLNADGGIAVEHLEAMGLSIDRLDAGIRMRQGVATITGKPFVVNGGTGDLDGITIDFTSPDPLVTVPKNKVILKDAALNPVLASALGKYGAVVFSNATQASGKMSLTVEQCERVPLGELIARKQDARAKIVIAVDELYLDGVVPRVISSAVDLGTGGIRGRIPPSTVTIGNGQADSNLVIEIARQVKDERTGREVLRGMPLRFSGGLGLANQDLRDFVVHIPPELLLRDIRRFFPQGASIPLKGTTSKLEFDLQKAIRDNAANVIPGLIGAGRDGQHQRGTEGEKPADNPLENLLEQLTGPDQQQKKESSRDQRQPDRDRRSR
ncbi:hypothetical protein [Fontivita pretiosa]|uniref:hypothetical protein n=1 Tax=Fontivita pretiosa TaxID=2989684 RepID=UPI003D185FF7